CRSPGDRLESTRYRDGGVRVARGFAPLLADSASLVPALDPSVCGAQARAGLPLSLLRGAGLVRAALSGLVVSAGRRVCFGVRAVCGSRGGHAPKKEPLAVRYRATIAYVGTRFHGWQVQANASRTVQAVVQDSLELLAHEPVRVEGAGRTD